MNRTAYPKPPTVGGCACNSIVYPARGLTLLACVYTSLLLCSSVYADEGGLEVFIGNWDLHAITLQPERKEVRYRERYQWTLDGKFIKGRAGPKPDGTRDDIYGTYDAKSGGYPFWVFSSSGSYLYLPPATWDARKRVMEWKNPANLDFNYQSSCHFPDNNTRRCRLIMTDWKGKVLQELEWTATRRKD